MSEIPDLILGQLPGDHITFENVVACDTVAVIHEDHSVISKVGSKDNNYIKTVEDRIIANENSTIRALNSVMAPPDNDRIEQVLTLTKTWKFGLVVGKFVLVWQYDGGPAQFIPRSAVIGWKPTVFESEELEEEDEYEELIDEYFEERFDDWEL